MILSHNGKAHAVLTRLEQGPASMADLRDACGLSATPSDAKRAWIMVGRLIQAGLIKRAMSYAITDAGSAALRELRTGRDVEVHDPGVPNVRVFRRDAA